MGKTEPRLFKGINVWRKLHNDEVIVYRCLQLLPDDRYVVKAVDHYHQPWTLDQVKVRDFYFVDSMFDEGFDYAASNASSTLEEAIAKFDAEFEI